VRVAVILSCLTLGIAAAGAHAEGIVPVEGGWAGESSAGLPVQFRVVEGRVTDTRFQFRWGFCGTFESKDAGADLPVDETGHWVFEDPRGQTLEGTFVAPDRVEGRIVSEERMLPGCPRTEATFTAMPGPPPPEPGSKVCEVRSRRVVGGSVRGKLTTSPLTDPDGPIASCDRAKKVMARVIALRLREDRKVLGFKCETEVAGYHPLAAVYTCSYRASTPMSAKLHFAIAYRGKAAFPNAR
jgi:hypothetical protein